VVSKSVSRYLVRNARAAFRSVSEEISDRLVAGWIIISLETIGGGACLII